MTSEVITLEKKLLTVTELIGELGCSRTTGYELIKTGRLRAVRLTNKGGIRIPVEAVEEFMESLDTVSPVDPVDLSSQPTPLSQPMRLTRWSHSIRSSGM